MRARDRQIDNPFSKDMQITAIRAAELSVIGWSGPQRHTNCSIPRPDL